MTARRGMAPRCGGLLAAWHPRVKLVYLCSPNNPTGNSARPAALEAVCSALDGKAIVVIDEAYIEWSRPTEPQRLARALSDARDPANPLQGAMRWPARASARCSPDPNMIQLAKRVIPPYSLAQPTIEAALRALEPREIAARPVEARGAARASANTCKTACAHRRWSKRYGRATRISC